MKIFKTIVFLIIFIILGLLEVFMYWNSNLHSKAMKSENNVEKIELGSQLRRAVTSVSLNIAEGTGSQTKRKFKSYLHIARDSLYEVVAILKLFERLYSIKSTQEQELCNEVGRLLNGLIRSLSENRGPGTKD